MKDSLNMKQLGKLEGKANQSRKDLTPKKTVSPRSHGRMGRIKNPTSMGY